MPTNERGQPSAVRVKSVYLIAAVKQCGEKPKTMRKPIETCRLLLDGENSTIQAKNVW